MAEVPKVGQAVSRTRRVTGLIMVALSAAIWARVGWLAVVYGSEFGYVDWVRFGFWLWLGAVVALIGIWLAYRSRVAAWAVAVTVAALFIVVFIHDYWLR